MRRLGLACRSHCYSSEEERRQGGAGAGRDRQGQGQDTSSHDALAYGKLDGVSFT